VPELIQRTRAFIDDGRTDRSKESFQGVRFEHFNQSGRPPISFHRSDFRKAKFNDCTFDGNDFSRSDFISCIAQDSRFIECDFLTSSITYSVFEQCSFARNRNFSADLFRCSVSNSIFCNQEIDRAAWRDTSFSDCQFTGCSVERSTLERIEFVRCRLDRLDLSQASINDVHFEGCSLTDAVLDPDYLGTYTFSATSLSGVQFSYRTLPLDFSITNSDDFASLQSHFENQQRWSEAFNISAIRSQILGTPNPSLEDLWRRCLIASIELEIVADAAENIRRLFRLAKHYLQIELLSVSDSLRMAAATELLSHLPLNQLIIEELASGGASLIRVVESLQHLETALARDSYGKARVRFQLQLDSEDEHAVRSAFEPIMWETARQHGIPFEIIGIGRGSIILEAATWFAVVMMLFRAARSASFTFVQIRLVLKAQDRLLQILDHKSKPRDVLSTVDELFQHIPKDGTAMDLVKEEVDQIGEAFQSLARHVKVGGVELLKLVREVRIFIGDLR
jgi:uncharacterized protein YjbI with pentapeptide repeats